MLKKLPIVLILIPLFGISYASEYTNTDFYETDNATLENGFRMIMKPRGEVRNVSIRLVVGVGTGDFPCGRKEIPHFLEHLLFTGTTKHTESELNDLIEKHGGGWNAETAKIQLLMRWIYSANTRGCPLKSCTRS